MPNIPSARETIRRADALDLRRQQQLLNQSASIGRLLDDPDAAAEITRLQGRIADLEQTLIEHKIALP